MLENEVIQDAARRLYESERSATPIRQLSRELPDMNIADGYAIQRACCALKLAAGRKLKGYKVGLTSKALQLASKIDEPTYGALFDDAFLAAGAAIPASRFILPRVEVELAFVLGKRLQGPACTLFDVLDATDYVVPALEIADFRIEQFDRDTWLPRTIADTIADNGAAAAVVIGGRPVKPADIDLRWVSAHLYRNGAIEESGVSAAVLHHPANSVAWLANKLSLHGEALEPGALIMCGSFTSALPAQSGDVFHADYGPLGAIGCRFIQGIHSCPPL